MYDGSASGPREKQNDVMTNLSCSEFNDRTIELAASRCERSSVPLGVISNQRELPGELAARIN